MKEKKSFRQGDVAFFKINKVPKGFKESGTVLEIKGEQNHLHKLVDVKLFVPENPATNEDDGGSLSLIAVVEMPETREMTHSGGPILTDDPTLLGHPPLKIPAGIFEVRQARQLHGRGD